jgi:hypothetical protein
LIFIHLACVRISSHSAFRNDLALCLLNTVGVPWLSGATWNLSHRSIWQVHIDRDTHLFLFRNTTVYYILFVLRVLYYEI